MPEEIIEFHKVDHAVEILRSYNSKFQFELLNLSKETVIIKSVSSNIFRAFSNTKYKPSKIYRKWANDNFEAILKDLKEIDSNKDYYKFVFKYAESLIAWWAKNSNSTNGYLVYGPALKMINVLVKMCQRSDDFFIEKLLPYIQIPFDQFTLQPLRFIINDLTDIKYRIKIPSHPSMSFINTPQLYKIIMNSIYNLSQMADVYPIVYDYYCWDEKH